MEFKMFEARHPFFDDDAPGPEMSFNFTVCARLRGPLTVEKLQGALQRLRRRHPLLAVRFALELADQGVYCTTADVPPIPLRVVEGATAETWVAEVEREIAQPSNYGTGPLCRCVWLRGGETSDLLLVCDHSTADGRAAIYALRDLLMFLADETLVLEPLLPPTLAELVPQPMRVKIAEKVAALSAKPAAPPPPAALEAAPRLPSYVIPFVLNQTETAALAARCRAEKVTVQAALCAAGVLPFAEQRPAEPVRRVEVPVDLRGRLNRPVGEAYGDYISLAVIDINYAPGQDLWDTARIASRALAGITDEQLLLDPTIMLRVVEQPVTLPFVTVAYDLSISNLGRVDIPVRYGPFELETIYGPTLNVLHSAHRILGVTTFNGQLCCTFTSRDPEAPQLVRRIRGALVVMAR